MKLYAIKSVHGELYLPVKSGSQTKAELCSVKDGIPRLFTTQKGATQAMKCWAKGIYKANGYWDSDDCEYGSAGNSYYVVEKIYIIPQRNRRLCDVQVVEWDIMEKAL